jgi:hypothetical protein
MNTELHVETWKQFVDECGTYLLADKWIPLVNDDITGYRLGIVFYREVNMKEEFRSVIIPIQVLFRGCPGFVDGLEDITRGFHWALGETSGEVGVQQSIMVKEMGTTVVNAKTWQQFSDECARYPLDNGWLALADGDPQRAAIGVVFYRVMNGHEESWSVSLLHSIVSREQPRFGAEGWSPFSRAFYNLLSDTLRTALEPSYALAEKQQEEREALETKKEIQ